MDEELRGLIDRFNSDGNRETLRFGLEKFFRDRNDPDPAQAAEQFVSTYLGADGKLNVPVAVGTPTPVVEPGIGAAAAPAPTPVPATPFAGVGQGSVFSALPTTEAGLDITGQTSGGRENIFNRLLAATPGFAQLPSAFQRATTGQFDPFNASFALQQALGPAGGIGGFGEFLQNTGRPTTGDLSSLFQQAMARYAPDGPVFEGGGGQRLNDLAPMLLGQFFRSQAPATFGSGIQNEVNRRLNAFLSGNPEAETTLFQRALQGEIPGLNLGFAR